MDIFIFSDNRTIKSCFAHIEKSKKYSVNYHACSEIRGLLKQLPNSSFIYLDISRYDDSAREKTLRELSRMKEHRYGIIDPESVIEDPASIFHNNASDYIGKEVYEKGISGERLKKAVSYGKWQSFAFSSLMQREKKKLTHKPHPAPAGLDWSEIIPGQEYRFSFMYVELDDQEELKKRLGDNRIHLMKTSFRKFIKKKVMSKRGRIWMWQDFGGLILFPFDGLLCDAILTCFRLILFRKVYSVEEFKFNTLISYRIALHLGSTAYTPDGDTGTIVSDSVNTIFNLGKKYVPPGNFYLTEDVLKYTPEKLKTCFINAGSFQGRQIKRMRLPI